jgi:multicomponent Na+:H+ antiporter subunit E
MTDRRAQGGVARPTQLLGLLLILMLSWVLWSGIYKPLLLWLGLLSSLLTLWMAQRMGFFRPAMPLLSLLRLPGYWWWLLQEVVKSSIEVARVVLSPSLPISPALVELRTTEVSEAGKVILGNSITLSPGTVTIDMHEDKLLVHCLTRDSAEELRSGEVQRRTAGLGVN